MESSNRPARTHEASAATLLVDCRNALGEGATWCDAAHALYWVDIEGARLWRWRAAGAHGGERCDSWEMPERIACFALTGDPDVLLVGLASRLAFFDTRRRALTPIVDVEPDRPTRLNDGRCDRAGAFVFGTKDESGGASPRAIGGYLPAERGLEPAAARAAARGDRERHRVFAGRLGDVFLRFADAGNPGVRLPAGRRCRSRPVVRAAGR
ncbi:SMP-30/Gluconolaconase/LRE-like region family protein [Burkholderia pseudomallei MSHR4378]|nr:SMP-30/Gluconolaconase/LRE-like region family protein [Burkholderia pseudomallei MSHR4378]